MIKSEVYKHNIRDLALKEGEFEYVAIADVEYTVSGQGKCTGRQGPTQLARSNITQCLEDTQRLFVAIIHKQDGRVEFLMLKRPGDDKVDVESPLKNCTAETTFKTNRDVSIVNASDLDVRIMRNETDGSSYFQMNNIDVKRMQKFKTTFNLKILDTSSWITKGGWDGQDMTRLLNGMDPVGRPDPMACPESFDGGITSREKLQALEAIRDLLTDKEYENEIADIIASM